MQKIASRSQQVADKAVSDLKTQSGNSNIYPVVLELGDMASIRKAASDLSGVKFDILMLNAGINQGTRNLTKDGYVKENGRETTKRRKNRKTKKKKKIEKREKESTRINAKQFLSLDLNKFSESIIWDIFCSEIYSSIN